MPRPYRVDENNRMDKKRIFYNRQSNRLQGYDYSSPGYYFVTIVSHNRLLIFGEIIQDQIQLSRVGKIVEDCWLEIPKHFQCVTFDEYVVMPNHFHSIVNIVEHQSLGVRYAPPYSTNNQNANLKGSPPQSLSAIIGSFKSAATKRINKAGLINGQSICSVIIMSISSEMKMIINGLLNISTSTRFNGKMTKSMYLIQ